ncbi:MAG: glutaminase A [Chloroflexi bacterium]|nr:glutaminase A [Chloroflexota bacterium]
MTDLQQTIETILAQCQRTEIAGSVYPTNQRAGVAPDCLAIALVTINGDVYSTGDDTQQLALQSISKVFTYGIALEDHGRDEVLARVGVEPTGHRYNAIFLEETTGRPFNPMVNAGAIAVADLINGEDLTDMLNRVIQICSQYAGRRLSVDAPTFTYEFQTDHRNRAIAHLMRSSGALRGRIDDVLHLYYQQCSLLVNAVDLAHMGATLANGGVNPTTGARALSKEYVRDVLSVMYSCGMYDSSGEWAYRVGLPAKSGVSGGILGVVPGRLGIATFSPPLSKVGHSIRGLQAFEALSQVLNLHVFDVFPAQVASE